MSYKKFNDLQNLYEGVVSESNEIDEYTELVYNVIIAEMVYRGHSESIIRTYVENISEEQILEKVESFVSLEEYNLNEEQTDLLFSFYQEQQILTEGWGNLRNIKNLKNLKNINALKNIKGSGAKLKNMVMSLFGKGPGSTKQLKLDLKGAKDGPGLLKRLQNLKTSTGNKLKNLRKGFDKKVTKTSDTLLGPDGKPLKTTKIVNPINKKNAAIVGGLGVVGGAAALSGGGNKKDDTSNNVTDKDTDKDKKDGGLSWKDMKDGGLLDKPLIPEKPKKKNAAGVEMTGSGTKDDPWISKAVKVKDVHIPMTDPKNPHYYKGIEKGLSNKADWLKKTSKSPAAKSGAFTDDQRWAQQLKHREWQDKNNRGAFKVKDNPDTPGNEAKQASKDAAFARRNKRLTDMGLKAVTKKVKTESYDTKPKPKKDAPAKAPQSAQESYDAYDLVLNYIMETEQASTIEEANYIMLEMDQNTIHEIVEEQKKTLGEGKKTVIGLGLLAAPALLSQLEKRWNPVKKARDKYQDKKATEYEKKSGTTKEDGYFR